MVRGALASGGAAAGTVLLAAPGGAQTAVDPTAIHQTGAETKTGTLTLVSADGMTPALILQAAANQSQPIGEIRTAEGRVQAAWRQTGGLTVFGGDNASPRPFEMWVKRGEDLNPTGPSVYINSGGHLRMLSSLVLSGRTVPGVADPVVLPSAASYMLGMWADVPSGNPAMVVRTNSDQSFVFWGLDKSGYRRIQIDADGTIRWAGAGLGNVDSQPAVVANDAQTDASIGRGTVNGVTALSLKGTPLAITPASAGSASLIIQTVASQTADVVNVVDTLGNNLFRVTRAGAVYSIAHPNRVSGVLQSTNGGGVFVGSESNHPFSVMTNNRYRSRWETNGNVALNGSISSYGGGVGVVGFANAGTVPTESPSGGFVLYGENGFLKVRSADGHLFDTTVQPDIASPSPTVEDLKSAVDAIRAVLKNLGVIV